MMSEKELLYIESFKNQCQKYLMIHNNLAYWSFSNKLLNRKEINLALELGYKIDCDKQVKLVKQEQLNNLMKIFG